MLTISIISAIQLQAQTAASPGAEANTSMPASSLSSTYVPIESWVYEAIEHLAASGYVETAFAGLRPWTRMDCARLIEEAEEQEPNLEATVQSEALVTSLKKEFAAELRRRNGERNRELRIESADLRSTILSGTPVTDGFHAAQSLINDYGRPYGQGENLYAGLTLRAASGHFAAYVHAEAQRAAIAPPRPSSAATAIALADLTPTAAAQSSSGLSRGRVLEAYVSYTFQDNQFTFGKQSLWWGPGKGGPLLFSNNAEPVTMLRYDRTRPFEIPGPGRWLGPIRLQAFAGRLAGHQFIHAVSQTYGQPGRSLSDQPFIHGQKVSFKPTPNLEFSVSRTVIFAGAGAPLTTRSFLRSFFSGGNSDGSTDPGDRRAAVDVQYRVPGIRNWLTAYVDTFTDDEPFPLRYPTESAWSPGLFLAHVPRIPRLDLRAEGYLTPHRDLFPGFYYFNVRYLSGYTNQRQLLGSWIGRESDGFQVWSHWWFSPRSFAEVSVRRVTQNSEFLHGGSLRDVRLAADVALRSDWQVRVEMQDERWRYPLLAPVPAHDFSTTIQVSYRPTGGKL